MAYSEETQAAVMAALLAGQSVSSVAKEYKLPKGTVSNWKRKAEAGGPMNRTQKAEQIGALLETLVEKNILALISASELMADKEYLRQQGAAELGTMFGITYDKVIRMLEAMAGDEDG